MNQQQKTGLFHAYHNAKVEFMDDINNEIKVSKMLGSLTKGSVQNDVFTETTYLGKIISWVVPVSDCTLLLTHLDRITDEHAIGVAAIVYGEGSHYANQFEGKELISESNTLIQLADMVEITDYLRSHSYNIGYLNYSPSQLVEMGVVKYEI